MEENKPKEEAAAKEEFLACGEFEEVEGGQYDEHGFYRLPDGDYYDPDGIYFNKEGKDKYGGHYDENFIYHPTKEFLEAAKEVQKEQDLINQYGLDEDAEGEGNLDEEEVKDSENPEINNWSEKDDKLEQEIEKRKSIHFCNWVSKSLWLKEDYLLSQNIKLLRKLDREKNFFFGDAFCRRTFRFEQKVNETSIFMANNDAFT